MSLLSSCLGKSTFRWKEEVQLHDGRVIVIERSVRTGEVPVELGQPPGESDYTLTFKTNDGKSVTWDGGKWFDPMLLDIDGEVPYVVATGRTELTYERYGCPRPPYFLFRYGGGEWERVSYEQFPKAIRKRNLLSGPTLQRETRAAVGRGLATLGDVQRSFFGLPSHYREIKEDMPIPGVCIAKGVRKTT
jgi:hypothetical protein